MGFETTLGAARGGKGRGVPRGLCLQPLSWRAGVRAGAHGETWAVGSNGSMGAAGHRGAAGDRGGRGPSGDCGEPGGGGRGGAVEGSGRLWEREGLRVSEGL